MMMAAVNWTLEQVLDQLNSGSTWSGNEITYSFPQNSGQFVGWSEAEGFVAMNDAQIEIVTYALAGWDDLIAADFNRVSSGSDIEISYTTTGIDYAHAYFPITGSVWLNPDYDDVKNPVVGQYGYATIIHELGHALGLNHMGDYNGEGEWAPSSFQDSTVLSIMSYFGPDHNDGEGKVQWADWEKDGIVHSAQTPMLNDIMAIQVMYGVETNTRLGNTIYGFNSNVTGAAAKIFDFSINEVPILTIFDSGGEDTLDLSGFLSKSIISLVSGTYSAVNEMTNNIAIAYTAVIENAIGGGGDDEITGNDGANKLTGGAGDDLLQGGGGVDTAFYSGKMADYTITAYDDGSYTVVAKDGDEGKDTLIGIETLSFSDGDMDLTDDTDDNSAPVVAINLADIQTKAGANFLFEISPNAFTDPDGDELAYMATLEDGSELPDWLSFDPDSLTFTVSPEAEDVGTVSIRVIASDGEKSVSDVFDIVVEQQENTAPVAVDDTAKLTEGKKVLVDVLANDFDSDGDEIDLSSAVVTSNNGKVSIQDGELLVAYSGKDLAKGQKAEIDVVYTISDGSSEAEGHLTVSVTGVVNTITGTAKKEVLRGTSSDDFLQSLKGNDTIVAGGGKDTLDGGEGKDTLWGEGGADVFRFTAKSGRDVIMDFSESERDRIDLSKIAEITDYKDLIKNHLKDNGDGDAVIRISSSSSITLDGVHSGDLDRGDFIF
jgi:serralysin